MILRSLLFLSLFLSVFSLNADQHVTLYTKQKGLSTTSLHLINENGLLPFCFLNGLVNGESKNCLKGNLKKSENYIENLLLLSDPNDFQGINNLLQFLQINISGPFSVAKYGGSFGVKDISCSNLHLSSLTLDDSMNNQFSSFQMNLLLEGLSLNCVLSWFYTIPIWGNDNGGLTAEAKNGNVNVVLSFTSPNFQNSPQINFQNSQCTSNIQLSNIQVQASSFSGKYIIPLLIPFVTGTITTELNSEVCSMIQSESLSGFQNLTSLYGAWAAPKLLPLPPLPAPSQFENTIINALPTSDQLFNWRDNSILSSLRNSTLLPLEEGDRKDPTSMLYKLDNLIKTYVMKDAGLFIPLSVNVVDIKNEYIKGKVDIVGINIQGLDTIQYIGLLDMLVDSNYTMQFSLSLESIEVDLFVNSSMTSDKNANLPVPQTVILNTALNNITLGFTVFLPVDETMISKCRIGSVVKDALGCVSNSILSIEIIRIDMEMGSLVGPSLSNAIDKGTTTLINNFISAIKIVQEKVLIETVPQTLNNVILPLLQDAINANLHTPQHVCTPYKTPAVRYGLDFMNNDVYSYLMSAVNSYLSTNNLDIAMLLNFVLPMSPPSTIPGYWGLPSLGTTGFWPGSLGPAGDMNLTFTSLYINGLNELQNITFLRPVEKTILSNDMLLGFRPSAHVNFTLGVEFLVKGPGIDIYDYFNITVAFRDIRILLNLTVDLNVGDVYNTTLGSLVSYPSCMIKALETWGFPNFTPTFGHSQVTIECRKCTSPELLLVKERLDNIKDFTAFSNFLNDGLYNSGPYGLGFLRHVPAWLEYEVYNKTDPLIEASCPRSFDEMGVNPLGMWPPLSYIYDPFNDTTTSATTTTTPFQWPSGLMMIFLGVCIVNFLLIIGYIFYLRSIVKKGVLLVITDQDFEGPSLLFHPLIPLRIRLFVPFCCICLTILFLSAHTMTGASFDIFIQIAGEDIKINKFFEFTLSQSIKQALDAQSYPLAFLIGGLSGVWPYIKIELMLFAWVCPPHYFGKVARGRMLTILDTLGKWSQVDLYVLILLMVAFNLRIQNPSGFQEVFSQGFISAIIMLNPKWGIYGFTSAVIGTIFCNQFIVWYNRKCIREVQEKQLKKRFNDLNYNNKPTQRSAALFAHHWETKDGRHYIAYGSVGVILITLCLLACATCIIWGSLATTLELDYYGVGADGLAWAYKQKNAMNPTLSIAQMMGVIGNQSSDNPYGILFLQAAVYIFTLLAPFLFVIMLFVMWAFRMTVTNQEKLLYIAEIVKDWCCLDVFVVAYVVTLVEVVNLGSYLGEQAAPLCHYIAEIAQNGQFDDSKGCFTLKAYPRAPGIDVIVSSVVLIYILQYIIMSGTSEAVTDREPEEHFIPGHRASSAYMDLLIDRTKPSPGFLVGRLLPRWLVKVGEVGIDSHGKRRYSSAAGSDDNLANFIRKTSFEDLGSLKFPKPDMNFKKPKSGSSSFIWGVKKAKSNDSLQDHLLDDEEKGGHSSSRSENNIRHLSDVFEEEDEKVNSTNKMKTILEKDEETRGSEEYPFIEDSGSENERRDSEETGLKIEKSSK